MKREKTERYSFAITGKTTTTTLPALWRRLRFAFLTYWPVFESHRVQI